MNWPENYMLLGWEHPNPNSIQPPMAALRFGLKGPHVIGESRLRRD
jgi:hypothetical protein